MVLGIVIGLGFAIFFPEPFLKVKTAVLEWTKNLFTNLKQ